MKQTALCLLVLMLALAGCGGGDKPGSTESAPGDLVASLEGLDEQGSIDPGGTLVVRFSEPMIPTSARPPITASPRAALRTTWSEDYQSLTVSSQSYFPPGTSVVLTLGETIRSAGGRTFPAPPGWKVLVHDAAQLVKRPTVSLSSGGRSLVSLLEFSLGMDSSSVEAALSVEPDLPLQLTWTGATLKIESTTMPKPSTEYDFLLRKEARDLQGRSLPEDIRWSFRTAGLAATPGLPGTEHPDAAIILRFNYALDEARALEAFYIDPAVSGEARLGEEGTELTFSPADPLPFNSTFEVGFSQPLLSAGGASLPPVAPQQFSIPGPVNSVSPADYEVVEPPGTVRIRFTRAMDKPSVEAAFTIQPAIEGTLSWERNTLVFTPQAGRLAESTDYDIALGPDAATADGDHPLTSGYRWNFRTTEEPPAAVFATYGPNLRVVDPGWDIPVDYESLSDVAAPISFSLYQLSAEEFADRYAHHYRQDPWWGEAREDIPVRGAKLDRSWAVDRIDRCTYESCSQETSIPGRLDSGLYLLQVSADATTDEMFLVASSLRVTAKTYAGQVVVWVTDASGNPKARADVQVAIANGQIGSQGTTDEDGLYDTWVFGSDQPVLVIVSKGDQVAVSGLDRSWDSVAARGCGGNYGWWGEPWDTSHGPVRLLAHLHTDRPIYRPGQTVYYKAILRQDEDALVSQLPEGTPVTVEVLDSGRNVLQTEALETNAFGTVNGSLVLSEGAMLGSYAVQVRVADDAFHQEFKVEDYRKPDFEVRLSLDSERYVTGDTIRATLEAEYFLGQPVAGAAVESTRYRVFSWWGWETDDYGYTETLDYEPRTIGRTDEQGLLTFEIPTEGFSDWYWDEEWFHRDVIGIEVTLDDGSHQSVSAFVRAPVYSSSERIDLLVEGYYHRRGESFPLRARVTDLDGQPVPGRVLTWSLNRYDDDSFDTMTETEAEFTTGDDGTARTDIVFTHPGWYEVTIRGVDLRGNATSRSRWFYVTGTIQRTRPGSTLEVYADRDQYAPGDTAHVIVESSFDGPALLTFERASVRRQQIIELTPPVTELDLPIRADDVPNVFVTVSAWGPPGDWWYGDEPPWDLLETASVELTVPAEGKELKIEATADRATYGPGDEAEFTLHATDWAGRPVAAELSLSLVDEAIYSLSEDLSPPMMMAFYARRSHLVDTYDSLAPWLAMYADGCGGGGGGPGVPTSPRSDFPDTAIWLPRILTGADGIARVKVSLPDNLTTWRLTVRAVTQDSRVGETKMNIVTQLPLAIRSLLPRTLTNGDTATLAAAVHNGSDEPLVARVGLAGTSLRLLEPPIQDVELRPGESQIVTWSAEITQPGEAIITLSAESDEYRDSIQMTIPVSPLAVREVNTVSGATLGRASIPFVIPQDADATSTIRLDLSRDATRSLLGGLEYLTGYPYGCVEQIMSAALPNAVIARAFRSLGMLEPELEADLSERITDGVQRLYSMQHPDGGWGWWYDDTTDAYQTAWVVFGLAVTREAGYPVDDGVLDRAANWMLGELPTMDPRTRAFALYSLAMAGRGQRNQALGLLEAAPQLDPFALSALALALERDGESAAAVQVAETLKSRVMVTDGMAHFWISGSDGEYNDKTMASEVRSTALAVSALVQIDGVESALVGKLVPWLISQRRAYGWGTTNETSFAILGLTDHLMASQALAGEVNFSVALDGAEILAGSLTPEDSSADLDIPFDGVGPGAHSVVVVSDSGARLYYRLTTEVYLPRTHVDAAGGVEVVRSYTDPATQKPLESIQAGQLVAVRLTVRMPESASYMIVEDHLPSGLEALNEGLNTTSRGLSEYEELEIYGANYYWQDYGYNYKEIHAGRVSLFITELSAGTHTFVYVARATYPGYYTAQPAEAYAMYNAETWGRSESSHLLIGPQLDAEAEDVDHSTPAP